MGDLEGDRKWEAVIENECVDKGFQCCVKKQHTPGLEKTPCFERSGRNEDLLVQLWRHRLPLRLCPKMVVALSIGSSLPLPLLEI